MKQFIRASALSALFATACLADSMEMDPAEMNNMEVQDTSMEMKEVKADDMNMESMDSMSDMDDMSFYVGGSFGYDNGSFAGREIVTTDKYVLASKGVVGGIHAGITQAFGDICCGLELFAGLGNNKVKSDIATYKMENTFGVALRFGTMVNKWMPYIKLAYANSGLTHKFTGAAKKDSVRLNGFVPGIGVEACIMDNMLIGFEWNYNFYAAKEMKVTDSINATDPKVATKVSARFSDARVRVGYKF